MKTSYTKVGIGRLCMLFGKTRHAYYDKGWREQFKLEAHEIVLEMVAEIRREIPGIGTPKLYHLLHQPLQKQGIKMGRDALHRLLQLEGLTIKGKKKYVSTTNSNHWMKKYPNLIKELTITQAEQVWVSDITYIQVEDDFNFLSSITDAYSRQIMGYCLHPTLETEGCLKALQMALSKRTSGTQLIHHSDRGSQYCCHEYVQLLQQSNIQISMTQKGDPYENAIAERINGILKKDFELGRKFSHRQQALEIVHKSISAYNKLRPHLSCDMLTPEQAHEMKGPLEKKWKSKPRKTQYVVVI